MQSLVERLIEIVSKESRVEFVVVNNGSKDRTGTLLRTLIGREPNLKVVEIEKNQGYGHGIKVGLQMAGGDFVGWTHADLQTNPADVLLAFQYLDNSFDRRIVKGVRLGRPLTDKIFSLGMSLFESILFKTRLRDINAQPTIFSADLLPQVLDGPDDFSLDLYTLLIAKKRGFKEHRVPVHFGPRYSGESKWNYSLRSRIGFIRRTIRFSFNLARRGGRSW